MAKVKAFRVEYGSSVEVRGVWHKFQCAIEIEPEENDDISEVKDRAWDTVYVEIEKQIKEIG